MYLTYGYTTGTISVVPAAGEECVVTAEAIELFVTTPLLDIKYGNDYPQPAIYLFFDVIPRRYPLKGNETTTVRVSWRATGFRSNGSQDPECNGSGEVHFSVDVEGAPRTRPSRH